jgi:glycosyltransferase involved in cell wall biosynthesis
MNSAVAIVQPSLFEGWSTVIEDAMAMSRNVIASDLDVNIEQLGDNGFYFERNSADGLASVLNNFIPKQINYSYKLKQLKFGMDFINIIEKIA